MFLSRWSSACGAGENRTQHMAENRRQDGYDVCLAWYTKGMCSRNCTRAADHMKYTAKDHKPLLDWYMIHYPKDANQSAVSPA